MTHEQVVLALIFVGLMQMYIMTKFFNPFR
jgi:hypothetical protein